MRRLQTALAVLSVAIGVSAFAAVIGVREWQRQQLKDLASDFAPNVLVVRYAPPPGFTVEPGQNYGITYEEALSLADLPGVASVAYIGGASTMLGGTVRVAQVPVTEEIFEVLGLDVAAGRALEDRDRLLGLPVVVAGATLARELYGSPAEAIGELLDTGGGAVARIVGVLEPIPDAVSEFARLNVAALQPLVEGGGPFGGAGRPAESQAYVRYEPGMQAAASAAVREAIATLPIAAATEVADAAQWLGTQMVFRNEVADELGRGSTWVVVLALVATVGNLANALGLRAVDRAKVLAVSRALGATRWRAAAHVILDGLLVGGIGTALGLAAWPLTMRLLATGVSGVEPTASALFTAGSAGLALSVLAALVPAVWTLRMPIYRALREQLSPPVWDGIALTGMAAGALALVVAATIGTGTTEWFQQRLREVGGDRLVVSTAVLGARTSVFSLPPLDETDAAAIADLPGVARFAVSTAESTTLVLGSGDGVTTIPTPAYRVDPEFFSIFPRPLLAGRVPAGPNETIIGTYVAALAFPDVPAGEVVGRTLAIGRPAGFGAAEAVTELEVVGVYASQPVVSIGDLYDGVIVRLRDVGVPIGRALVTDFHIVLEPEADPALVKQAIAAVIDSHHGGAYAPAVVHEPAGDLSAARSAMASVAGAWRTIAWLSFAIGGIGLATIVSVRLVRSRPEHALKRALGATVARIAGISTATALRIATGAALVGVTAAIGVSYWVSTLAPWGFTLPIIQALVALVVSILVGLLAVIVPVASLGRFSPWEVLKGE